MMKDITKHRPRHINQTSSPYFLTGRTYFGLPYFDTKEKKELALLSAIKLACQNYHLTLDAWVVLDNHYHLLFRPPGCGWDLGIASKLANSENRIESATFVAILCLRFFLAINNLRKQIHLEGLEEACS